jgi:peptidoglycan/LPS O-acetylase OafA/YrhL
MTDLTTLHPTPTSHHRFHLLDALRGVAAVLVMVSHIKYIAHRIGLHSGFLAVDFFFCLSGFVIAASYERRLLSGLRARDFFAARVIRLYPVYFLGISLALLLELTLPRDLGGSPLTAFAMATFLLPNLHFSSSIFAFPLNPPSWSLLMEMVANVLYLALIKTRSASAPVLSLIAVIALVILSVLVYRGEILESFGIVHSDHHLLYGVARVLPSFFLGVLALRLFRDGASLHLSAALRLPFALAIAIGLIFLLESPFASMRNNPVYLLCIAFFFPLLTCVGASANPPIAWTKLCTLLGDLSYPLYLIHIPFLEFANSRLFLHLNSKAHFALSVGAMLLAVITSLLLARIFDTPIRRYLTNLYRNATASPAIAV